jgi:ABC-type phosphate/phosphonate transport system substrate-binding protein
MDSATMCGLNYKLLSKKIDTGELRIIGTSDDYPENILGAHPAFSNEDREKITDIIVNMHNDAQGREVLKAMEDMKVKDFVKYNKEVEVVTEKLLREANMM